MNINTTMIIELLLAALVIMCVIITAHMSDKVREMEKHQGFIEISLDDIEAEIQRIRQQHMELAEVMRRLQETMRQLNATLEKMGGEGHERDNR